MLLQATLAAGLQLRQGVGIAPVLPQEFGVIGLQSLLFLVVAAAGRFGPRPVFGGDLLHH
ncbi:MAG TPA: hypothetical protein GXX28_04625, partial [Firmicutes bacterium]|nr:hypothetical protein [Bacillota bacterium]